jgi:transcriptional regulator with XRE-family HTH domain
LAAHLGVDRSTVIRWERGQTEPQPIHRAALADALGVPRGELTELLGEPSAIASSRPLPDSAAVALDDQEALELARRVAASDVGTETLDRLELAIDELAIGYPVTPPAELLGPVHRHLRFVMRLVDARKTLDEHRRLLVVGGWLSLLAATLHIDLRQRASTRQWLATAASLARHSSHAEIEAWRYETEAWHRLTDGDYRKAADLSRAARTMAPRGSSVAIQATAQEGRAWARLGDPNATYRALADVERAASALARPEQPEHHYRYDPDKATAYVATTLAWLGDPAAEEFARNAIATFEPRAAATGRWPRRLAAAHIDLAAALLPAGKIDEACASAQAAILSGRLVPSNHWRALEVVRTVEARGLPEATELGDAYEQMRRHPAAAVARHN